MRLAPTVGLTLLSALSVWAQTWRPMGPPGGDVRSLGADPNDSRRIYLGTSDGHIFGSTDAGEHWQLLGRAGSHLDAVVSAILVDPRDSRVLYAATWTQEPAAGNGLYISRDGGKRWQQAAYGLPEAPIQDLAIVGSIFLASMQTGGLYITCDRGKTWARIEGTLAEGYFPVVTTRDSASPIFAASATEGLYAVELSTAAAAGRTNAQDP